MSAKSQHELVLAVLAALMTKPCTVVDLARKTGHCHSSIHRFVGELHDRCLVYVKAWDRRGWNTVPVYAWQPSIGEIPDQAAPRTGGRVRILEAA